jgi:hypothetical protein
MASFYVLDCFELCFLCALLSVSMVLSTFPTCVGSSSLFESIRSIDVFYCVFYYLDVSQ